MATRAHRHLSFAVIKVYNVATSQTVTIGKTCKFATGSETDVQDAGAGSDGEIGTVLSCTDGSTGVIAAGKQVEVALLGNQIVPMLVGTGGTTAGKKQVVVSDGITDAAANGGGTTAVETVGIALQAGVAGDVVGVLQGGANSRVST